MWVRFSGRSPAKRITLGEATAFGIAALLFFDLGEKQAQAALSHPLTIRDLDLVTGFAGQSGIECGPRQKKSAFRVCRVSCHQALGGLDP
ncbi:MAG: hypothetical protein QOF70_7104, partial [Acetobacteraceae bacterium]|nr:hypothetical protein [Acetobacteraceae bacterium]